MRLITHILLVFTILSSQYSIDAEEIIRLENLDYKNQDLKKLREEIFHNLRITKSTIFAKNNELFPLRFVVYRVKPKDNFFYIMARTGVDLETLASANLLSSPQDIHEGMDLWIPNIRGSFRNSKMEYNEENKKKIAEKYNVGAAMVSYDKKESRWFIAGQSLSPIEKSFFYGFAFSHPLPEGRMSSKYGYRKDPFSKKKTFHGGVDISAPEGTSVLASAEGEVIFAGRKKGYGKLIILKHKLGYETRYGHLSKIDVSLKDSIQKGDKIGEVGSTGRSTGPHLHFEVRRFKRNQKPEFEKHL